MKELIRVDGVSVKYRLAKEAPATLQEFLIQKLKGKRVRYEDFWALKNISLNLRKGQRLGVIGLNGSGKSTLLKVIAGVLEPSDGRIVRQGRIAPLIELGAGFDMELTGRENVYLNGTILGLSNRQVTERFDRIVEFSGLGDFVYAPLRSYSSGMIARLAFAIAVEVEADLLIIDEVLAVGDEGFRKKCQKRIAAAIKDGVSVLFVSHNMDEIQSLCDRGVWLNKGRMVASGDAVSIARKYLVHFDETVFDDISPDNPDKEYIDTMFLKGITNGYSVDGRRVYNPRKRVSRAELAVFLNRVLKIDAKGSLNPVFEDVSETHWAARQIYALVDGGLWPGFDEPWLWRHFRPDDYVLTRDLASILAGIDPDKNMDGLSESMEYINRGDLARILCLFFDIHMDEEIPGNHRQVS